MEYIISSRNFEGSEKKGNLFFRGNEFKESKDSISLLEGEIIDEKEIDFKTVSELLSTSYIGNFNFLYYDIRKQKLYVKNDKFGTYSLYIYSKNGDLILSNNIWNIIRLLKEEEVIISRSYFKLMLGYWGVDIDAKTLFEGVMEVNAGFNIEIDINTAEITSSKYYSLEQDPKYSIEEATTKLDHDLDYTFSRIAKLNTDKTLGFGNSGGLDSRLVPIYASQNNLRSIGLTTVNEKPKMFFDSITKLNAQKIANHYNIPNYCISHIVRRHDRRMVLDIRNNPFGPSQLLKNGYDQLPKFDYYVTGGNGFIVGGAWQNLLSLKSDNEFKEKFLSYHSKFNAYLWGNGNLELLNRLFSKNDQELIASQKIRFFEQNKHKDRLSLIRSFHQFSMNKRSPSGGFESMNRLYKTYNIYYPIVFENTLNWKAEFFPGRSVLKNLIRKKSETLYNIPSQNYDRLDGRPLSIKEKIIRRLANKYRNIGLDYENWVLDKDFMNYANEVFSRKNDLFFDYLNMSKEYFISLDIMSNLRPHVSLDFLKLKRIFDIVEYREFEIFDEEIFRIKQ